MSYFRVSNPSTSEVNVPDLGITIAGSASNIVLSNQFSKEDLENSKDLEALINAGTLTAQVNLDGNWVTVSAADFNANIDIASAAENLYEIANTIDNQRLVNNSDASAGTQLHQHDTRYYTKAELNSTANATSGAHQIGIDVTPAFTNFTPASPNVQSALEAIDNAFSATVTLDSAYTNDPDGVLNVNGTSKPLNFRSNNVNNVIVSRTDGSNVQNLLRTDVSANEVVIGSAQVGALQKVNLRIPTDLIVEGNIQFTGEITDTTVNELNVTNANIRLRNNATSVPGANAYIEVERGTDGADAQLLWDETSDRWRAGLNGATQLIALLDTDEIVTGIYDFQGGAASEPNMYLTNKAVAPTTSLGGAAQFPIAMIDGILCVYDKTNSRNKFLSVSREYMVFSGRDNANNSNEYARVATFTSNQAGNRLIRNATLVGISAQTNGSATWTARVRRNGNTTNLASLSITAASGAQDSTLNVNFNAGDSVEVYIEGSNVNRPVIKLEFAYRF